MKRLILLRGLPGSGKSSTAFKLMDWLDGPRVHLEADDFHMINGKYCYEPKYAIYAHRYCQSNTAYHLNKGSSVIVANTFIDIKEMMPYFEIAKDFDVEVLIYECKGDFGSIHGVPDNVIQSMKERWKEFCTECNYGYEKISIVHNISLITSNNTTARR